MVLLVLSGAILEINVSLVDMKCFIGFIFATGNFVSFFREYSVSISARKALLNLRGISQKKTPPFFIVILQSTWHDYSLCKVSEKVNYSLGNHLNYSRTTVVFPMIIKSQIHNKKYIYLNFLAERSKLTYDSSHSNANPRKKMQYMVDKSF